MVNDPPERDPPEATDQTRSGFVALVGRPNVGKSTLLNRLVGSKVSIVSDKPQTTRNRIAGILTLDQRQAIFVDTPGIHKPKHAMNTRMVKAAFETLQQVEAVALLTDATERFGGGDAFVLEQLSRRQSGPVYLLVNKVDLVQKPSLLPLAQTWSERFAFERVFMLSALTGDGVEGFLDCVLGCLPIAPFCFPPDQVSDVSLRFLAQEIVREKILLNTRDEIPFTTSVLLEDFHEDPQTGMISITAQVMVERDSQKGILIGRRGSMLARFGSEARKELEQITGKKVYLDLRVKVRERWREDLNLLARLGLGP